MAALVGAYALTPGVGLKHVTLSPKHRRAQTRVSVSRARSCLVRQEHLRITRAAYIPRQGCNNYKFIINYAKNAARFIRQAIFITDRN